MDKKTLKFIKTILEWWEKCGRDFPWRNTSNPYNILITEILLQRTNANSVNRIYSKLFQKYPSIIELSQANIDELKEIIETLGLGNRRPFQILELAKKIVKNYGGEIPKDEKFLMELPGVGRYTCSSVMCIAYKKNKPMVDSNFIRVIRRYFSFKSEKDHHDPKIWNFAAKMVPKGKCKEFNLGLIDFSSAICIPKSPKCDICTLNVECDYFSHKN